METRGLGDPRKALSIVLAVVMTIVVIAGCGGSSDEGGGGDPDAASTEDGPANVGGALQLADEGEALTLSPFTEVPDNSSARVFSQIIEPLYRTDSEGAVVPWLVEDTKPSKDFRTWTLTLRDGVEFSNGQPMTAADVVFSLNTARANPTWKAFFEAITAVQATDPGTVVVKTDREYPVLETTLSLFAAGIVPKDFGGMDEKEFERKPTGTGPFMLDEWVSGQRITLKKNPNYWDEGKPYLDRLVFNFVEDDESRALQLQGGELDLIATPPNAKVASLESSPGLEVGQFALAYPDYLVLNVRKPLFADQRIREAIDLAVDREGIVNVALSGIGEPGGSWFPPAVDFYDAGLVGERDVEKAKELVAEAKADGVDPTFTMLIESGGSYARFASQIIQENLQEVGFSMKIEQADASTSLDKVFGGDYEASIFGLTSDIPEPSEIVSFYLELEAFATGAETEEMQRVFRQVVSEPDEAKRAQLYQQIQQIVADDDNLVVLDYKPWTWAMKDTVEGFDLPPTGIPWLADVSLGS